MQRPAFWCRSNDGYVGFKVSKAALIPQPMSSNIEDEAVDEFMDRFAEAVRYIRRGYGMRAREMTLRDGQGITSEENDVLGILSSRPDGYRMGELAERAQCHTSNAVRSVRSLVKQGLVIKKRAAEDGRGTKAMLTPEGWELATRIKLRRREFFKEIQRELDPGGEQQLLEALQLLHRLLEKVARRSQLTE